MKNSLIKKDLNRRKMKMVMKAVKGKIIELCFIFASIFIVKINQLKISH